MARNLPLAFGLGLAGAVLIDKGVPMFKGAFSGSSSSGTAVNVTPPAGLGQVGQVTPGDLATSGAAFGWAGSELQDWMDVIKIESGGDPTAVNKGSRASLIGQFLPMNWGKYGPGSDPSKNPSVKQQLDSMALYIHQRYSTPSNALAHEHQYGWY